MSRWAGRAPQALLVCVAAFGMLLGPADVQAQRDAELEAEYQRAVQTAQDGEVEQAAAQFAALLERLHDAHPLATLTIYGAARSYQKLKTAADACRAVDLFTRFLGREDAEAEKRERASKALSALIARCSERPTVRAPLPRDPKPKVREVAPTSTSWAPDAGTDEFGGYAIATIAGVEVRFRYCPPGEFVMGSPASESGRIVSEGPQHVVALTKGFWLADSEVTQRLWTAVDPLNPSEFKGMGLPVERVRWLDVASWTKQANAQSPGLNLRLPTEAEWEYAARAGTTGATYRSSDVATTLGTIAWHSDNGGGRTHPVQYKAPNAWGLYDMLGNVWEWCADGARVYQGSHAADPSGPTRGGRVRRGGSFLATPEYVRAAFRLTSPPDYRSSALGFRLARDL